MSQNNCEVLALPGVPYEMKILVEHFFREFKKNRKLDSIVQKTIFIRNIPESQLAYMLKEWEASINKDIKLAYLPSPGVVRLRLSGISNSKAKIESLIQCELDKLNSIVKYDDNSKDLNQLVYDLCKFKSDYSIATTGYAGPTGGTEDNPVGTVFITINSLNGSITEKILFSGDRKIILNQVRIKALELLIDEIKKHE